MDGLGLPNPTVDGSRWGLASAELDGALMLQLGLRLI